MTKFVQCEKCKGRNGKISNAVGYISQWITTPNGAKVEQLIECECHIKWRERVDVEGKAKRANLNPSLIDYSPDSYVGQSSRHSVDRIVKFVERSLSPDETSEVKGFLASSVLYMYGRNGTQKTTIANYMAYQFLKAGKSAYYILMSDLYKILIDAKKNPDALDKLDRIAEKDLLIIDEAFDSEKVAFFEGDVPLLDTFLRTRIQTKNKGIVFISNIHIDDITNASYKNRYGKTVKSLFCNCTSLKDLVQRNVKLCNGFMEFDDNYTELVASDSLINAMEDLF